MTSKKQPLFKCSVGSEFKLQWPQISNVLSITTADQVLKLLEQNPLTTLTEKMDGSNLCLSSGHWIASRRRVILDEPKQEDLNKYKFCRESLGTLGDILPKVATLAEELQAHFPGLDLEVMLYGEWMQKGTATSQTDKFAYQNRGFKVGHIYAFGLAIHFALDQTPSQIQETEQIFTQKLKWNCIVVKEPIQYFVICMNMALEQFLKAHFIECVPLIAEITFHQVLTTEQFSQQLVKGDIEGFVLSAANMLLKWKAFEEDERASQRDALQILENRLSNPDLKSILESLTKVCQSTTPEDNQNTGLSKKPNKALYAQLFNSASSKYPTLNDYLVAEKSSVDEDIVEIIKSYEKTMYEEMVKDFVDAGYKLETEYDKEMRGNLRAKIKSEAAKTLKRKINF